MNHRLFRPFVTIGALAISVFILAQPLAHAMEAELSPAQSRNSSPGKTRLNPVLVSPTPLQSFANQGGIWTYSHINTILASPSFQQDLNATSGIMSRSEGSPTISIRGSSQSGRVLTLVDGVPIYSATGVGSQQLLLPLENYKQIEVYKTPSSVFYGTSAMGGAINFTSEDLERPRARLQVAGYETLGVQRKSAYMAAPLLKDKNNYLQVSGNLSADEGNFPYSTAETPTARKRLDNGQDLHRVHIKGRQKIRRLQLEESVIIANQNKRAPGSLYFPGVSNTQTSAQLLALGVRSQDVPYGEMSFRSSGLFEHIRSLDDFSSAHTSAQTLQQTLRYELTEVETSPEFTVNWRTEQLKASYLGPSQLTDNQPELGLRLLFPGGEQWPHWKVQTGARYLARFGKFVTAFGAFYNKGNDHAWGSYSEGFRAPTLTDRFAQSVVYNGNGSLAPEVSRGIEVGYRRRLWGPSLYDQQGLFFTVSGFRTKYEQLIDYTSNGVSVTPINRSTAQVRGIETELGFQGGVWRTSFGVDFTESADDKTMRDLRLVPRQKHMAKGAYQWGAVETEVRYTYMSAYLDQRLTPQASPGEMAELGPWRTVDMSVQTVGFANFQLQAGVMNIFNEQRQWTFGYPEPGRIVYLSYQREL